MKRYWIKFALQLAGQPADFYSGARKIIRNVHWTLPWEEVDDLSLADAGFKSAKLAQLRRNYIHSESIKAAAQLWEGRLKRNKYGSVGFHCFNHYIKGTDKSHEEFLAAERAGIRQRSKRASVMGPCIQSVSITLLPNSRTSVDLFYRTTELFKKFPADLVFIRDELLASFDFTSAPIDHLNFHFANVTCHPMYFVTLLPILKSPIFAMVKIKNRDPYFHDWMVKWTARYLCSEYMRGIQKFQQALRVRKDALERLDESLLLEIQLYLRDNHPGYRNDYEDPDEEKD
jgi:hypothetical protein